METVSRKSSSTSTTLSRRTSRSSRHKPSAFSLPTVHNQVLQRMVLLLIHTNTPAHTKEMDGHPDWAVSPRLKRALSPETNGADQTSKMQQRGSEPGVPQNRRGRLPDRRMCSHECQRSASGKNAIMRKNVSDTKQFSVVSPPCRMPSACRVASRLFSSSGIERASCPCKQASKTGETKRLYLIPLADHRIVES